MKKEQYGFDKNFTFWKMKELIGCSRLTHEVLHDYLHTEWWFRKMLPWEYCSKTFQKVCFPMNRECLNNDIYLCSYQDKPYYFGLGLKEPEVTDDMLENGAWFVYTWSD